MQRQFIFQPEYWRQFRILLVRSRHDPRARKALFIRFAGLTYFVAVIAYYYNLFSSFHDPASAFVMGCVLAAIFVIVAAVRFSHWRESQRQLAADIASAGTETTSRLQHLAHGLAAVIERALAERWLQTHSVPEGATPVARRIQIETLRRHGVWDEIPQPVRLAMMEPDGSWPDARVHFILSTGEKLNTLLWALALQASLRPVEELLSNLSMGKLSKSLAKPAPGIRPTWDLRLERDRAYQYSLRCFTEGVHRGDIDPEDEKQAQAVADLMGNIADEPAMDFLAGTSTITELGNAAVRQAGSSAAQRAVLLGKIMDVLDGKDVWTELTEIVYAPLLCERRLDDTTQERPT